MIKNIFINFFRRFFDFWVSLFTNFYNSKYSSYFYSFLTFSFGMLICSFFFSARFLRERIPREILFEWDPWSFLFMFIMFILNCYLIITKLIGTQIKNGIVNKILLGIIIIYKDSLLRMHKIFVKNNVSLDLIFARSCDFIYNIVLNHGKYLHIYCHIFFYFVIVFPRFLVTICFFIDVVINKEFFYLYKIIWVLIIPLLWNIFYYGLEKFIMYRFSYIKFYFDIVFLKDQKIIKEKYGFDCKSMFHFTYKASSPAAQTFPLSTKEKNQIMNIDVPRMHHTFVNLTGYFAADGIFYNTKLYNVLKYFFLLMHIIIFGYYIFNIIKCL